MKGLKQKIITECICVGWNQTNTKRNGQENERTGQENMC
jgi:hypothetical protein